MKDILEIFKDASIGLIILVAIAYFIKIYIEKRIEGLASRIADIGKVSLDLKKGLREEERKELLTFRVAIEKWENLLQTLMFDFTMLPPSKAQIAPFYMQDKKLFLDVKIAVVKVSTYLRDKELEIQLMAAINKIRNTYYPLITEAMPRLIDLQSKLIPIGYKLKQFEKSGLTDMTYAPTTLERDEHLKNQSLMTQEMQIFSENLLREYKNIAGQMYEVKEAVNKYIYRPIHTVDIDND
jgi:hypothetical protein